MKNCVKLLTIVGALGLYAAVDKNCSLCHWLNLRLMEIGRTASIATPRQWNNLPLSIRKSPLIAVFKRHLKTYRFKGVYDF